MIDLLKKNIETEMNMLREISIFLNRMDSADPKERKLLISVIDSLKKNIKILNNSIPALLKNVTGVQKLPAKSQPTGLENLTFKKSGHDVDVTIQIKDRDKFLKELSISENLIRKLKKKKPEEAEVYKEFMAARGYLKLSNKFFLNTSINLINKGYFRSLSLEIKKANLDILHETYVAMIIFTTFISVFAALILTAFLLFFNVGLVWPIFSAYAGSYLTRFTQVIWVLPAIPVLVFSVLYLYPSTERKSIAKKIDQELPFAVIHMSAISGSGIEPSEIFRIIGVNREYPALRREIRKILNQINIYGYDLVTALNNVSKNSPSTKLSELFAGLSTTIYSGGSLQTFFEKRAETLPISYRLDREKFTKVAETFMDIYISVVIAAPMILMLLLIMIQISGAGFGFTNAQTTALIITVISLINVLFIGFLQIKQPTY